MNNENDESDDIEKLLANLDELNNLDFNAEGNICSRGGKFERSLVEICITLMNEFILNIYFNFKKISSHSLAHAKTTMNMIG